MSVQCVFVSLCFIIHLFQFWQNCKILLKYSLYSVSIILSLWTDHIFLNWNTVKQCFKNSGFFPSDSAEDCETCYHGFYLPHGISIDHEGNLWLTDVALHQVFKFPPGGAETPLIMLGEKLVPGPDKDHFCKPTDVAVDPATGNFFVADGYCNSRIMKFSPQGEFLMEWGKTAYSKCNRLYSRCVHIGIKSGFWVTECNCHLHITCVEFEAQAVRHTIIYRTQSPATQESLSKIPKISKWLRVNRIDCISLIHGETKQLFVKQF